MEQTPYEFSNVFPDAYESFLNSGWRDIDFVQDADNVTKLVGKNPVGETVEIALPVGYKPGQGMSDEQMLTLLEVNGVALQQLDVTGFFISGYAANWGFSVPDEPVPTTYLIKQHSTSPDKQLRYYLNASGPNDTLLTINQNGVRVDSVQLGNVDNIFMLGDYMVKNGWLQ